MLEVGQWVKDHPQTSSDYVDLVKRVRSGEHVECLLVFAGNYKTGEAAYEKSSWIELFKFCFDGDEFVCSEEEEFINDCRKFRLVFDASRNFIKNTQKMLEIARNAAEFRAVSVPLNTIEDVDALLALMGSENAG